MNDQKIAVFGVGRVGLPLALVLAEKGYRVTGIDVDPYRIALLKRKIMPFLEEGADPLLSKYGGNMFQVFSPEHISRVVPQSSILIFTLGTPIDETNSPSFKQIEESLAQIIPYLQEGQLIILRSTVSPGATEQISRQLEQQTRFKIGQDLFLAYCPERIAEGKSIEELAQIPQIIGTIDQVSADKAAEVFSKIAPEIIFSKPKPAELAKLYCNMYRYIDFAIGNEFMMIAEDYGCDIYEVLHLTNHNYKRGGIKSPGFTAGPCLVKDGFFLIDKSPYMELVTAAWRLNENIPGYLLARIKSHYLNLHQKKVAILGLSFKKNIDDVRYSLSPKMKRYFSAEGAKVSVYDPYIDSEPLEDALKGANILIIGINHDEFNKLKLEEIRELVSDNCLICDVWNIFGKGKILFYLNDYFLKSPKQKVVEKYQSNGELKRVSLGKRENNDDKLRVNK